MASFAISILFRPIVGTNGGNQPVGREDELSERIVVMGLAVPAVMMVVMIMVILMKATRSMVCGDLMVGL